MTNCRSVSSCDDVGEIFGFATDICPENGHLQCVCQTPNTDGNSSYYTHTQEQIRTHWWCHTCHTKHTRSLLHTYCSFLLPIQTFVFFHPFSHPFSSTPSVMGFSTPSVIRFLLPLQSSVFLYPFNHVFFYHFSHFFHLCFLFQEG